MDDIFVDFQLGELSNSPELQAKAEAYLEDLTAVGHDPLSVVGLAQRLAEKSMRGELFDDDEMNALLGISL